MPQPIPARRRNRPPAAAVAAVQVHGAARAGPATGAAAALAHRAHRPGAGRGPGHRGRRRPHPPRLGGARRGAGPADHRARPGASTRTAGRCRTRSSRCGRPTPAGRYLHKADQHDAPLDPNFTGAGRVLTDAEGRYRFVTIRPGAYPWGNHANAWRPAHIHFSLFGRAFTQRLVTQMYFPDDPLVPARSDHATRCGTREARARMTARFDLDATEESYALGYEWDIVLRGRDATPMENRP